jgi:hypothetical protein
MMELSLPDVWSKVKVFPASIQGKGTGYIPGLIANAAASGEASIPMQGSVAVLVGEDRLDDITKQVAHNSQHMGEPGYYDGTITAQGLPDVRSDDDAGRISGTRVREALAKGDRDSVARMLDPRLVQSPEFESVFAQMREEMRRTGLLTKMTEAIMNEMGMGASETGPGATRGGRHGAGSWSSFNPRGAFLDDEEEDGDHLNPGTKMAPGADMVYQQMLRSPSTRMLNMANHGTANDHIPGQDVLDQKDDEEQDLPKPSDLGD